MWVSKLSEVIGLRNVYDHYELGKELGKGKFGNVKLARHLESGEHVAIKVIKKRDVPLQELELQKREIEVLKLC